MQILQTREESKKKFNDQFMVIFLSAARYTIPRNN